MGLGGGAVAGVVLAVIVFVFFACTFAHWLFESRTGRTTASYFGRLSDHVSSFWYSMAHSCQSFGSGLRSSNSRNSRLYEEFEDGEEDEIFSRDSNYLAFEDEEDDRLIQNDMYQPNSDRFSLVLPGPHAPYAMISAEEESNDEYDHQYHHLTPRSRASGDFARLGSDSTPAASSGHEDTDIGSGYASLNRDFRPFSNTVVSNTDSGNFTMDGTDSAATVHKASPHASSDESFEMVTHPSVA